MRKAKYNLVSYSAGKVVATEQLEGTRSEARAKARQLDVNATRQVTHVVFVKYVDS